MAKKKAVSTDTDKSEGQTVNGSIVLATPEQENLLARLDKLDDSAWRELQDAEFWRADKDGDELRGIYAGFERKNKYLEHRFLRNDPNSGNVVETRVNGTHVLTRMLKNIEPGTAVSIRRTGTKATERGGTPVTLFSIRVMA